jgi:hypothetical protein
VPTLTVTATQGGGTFGGMLLRVLVLTNTATVQNGATVFTSAAYNASITTTVTGSRVYGATTSGHDVPVAEPLCTFIDAYSDATNLEYYGSFRTTSATGTPGATLVGSSTAYDGFGGMAAAEILPNGTITEDGSAPVVVTSDTLTALTTASFTPPDGSLLVALIGSDGSGSATTTMTVSGGGLTWTEQAKANASNQEYAGVWIARVAAAAAAGSGVAKSRQHQKRHTGRRHGALRAQMQMAFGSVQPDTLGPWQVILVGQRGPAVAESTRATYT